MGAGEEIHEGETEPRACSKLTGRERDVLGLIAEGLTNKAIARSLEIAPSTVRGYVESILTKLNVSNRTAAAALWLKSGNEMARAE